MQLDEVTVSGPTRSRACPSPAPWKSWPRPPTTCWSSNPRARTGPRDDQDFDAPGRQSSAAQGVTLASDGVHRKLVIAYIDIGQAEDWRWYWTWSRRNCRSDGSTAPRTGPTTSWPLDPDGWDGNYVVRYWDPAWKDVVMHGVGPGPDRDWVNPSWTRCSSARIRRHLPGLGGGLRARGRHGRGRGRGPGRGPGDDRASSPRCAPIRPRARNPDFLIIQQNAAWLLERPSRNSSDAIDAIAQEHVFQDGIATDDWDDPGGLRHAHRGGLKRGIRGCAGPCSIEDHGMPVFNAEYACRTALRNLCPLP